MVAIIIFEEFYAKFRVVEHLLLLGTGHTEGVHNRTLRILIPLIATPFSKCTCAYSFKN